MENGSSLFAWLKPDLASMGLNDCSTDRQANAHSATLGCHEGLEQLGSNVGVNAGAGILDDKSRKSSWASPG